MPLVHLLDLFCILQINLPSGLISSLDVAMSDRKLVSGGTSPEDFGSRQFPKVCYTPHARLTHKLIKFMRQCTFFFFI